jgi:YegS/Rv2252/BmrU family lipid kinase
MGDVATQGHDVALICNPSAGGGRAGRLLPRAERALRDLGLTVRTATTRDLPHACDLAAVSGAAGEITAAFGGDGLVGCVAGVLRAHPGAVLAILPGGRGNDTARALGIPRELDGACGVVASGVERPLDLGEVDGRPFVGIASLGFDSDANRIANQAPSRLGALVYVYGALRALVGWKPAGFELLLDGETLRATGYSVAACNSPYYGGGMLLAPDARPDDGLLDVVVISELSKRAFLLTLPRAFRGTHVRNPAVRILRCRELEVRSSRPFVVYADGDPIGATPATIRALPSAVRVLVPR